MVNVHPLLKQKFNNFEELEKMIEQIEDNVEKGTIFEYFAYYYLFHNANYYNISEIWMEKDIPAEIRKELKLEKTDYGVDGVFLRKDGKYVAYQAKFRSGRVAPTAHELATFWAESEYADFRLIISNSYSLPKVASKKKNQLSILIDAFMELDIEFFNNMYEFFNNNLVKVKEKYTPRDYQKKMICDIIKGFESADRGKVIAACGVGKTLTALWLQEYMKTNTVLYIVPSLALIKQTLESWTEHCNESFDYLCVCSDNTVIDYTEDEIQLNTSDVDFPVTTEPSIIKRFLLESNSIKKVVFSTYHSLDAIVNALQDNNTFQFDLGIFDESHRTAGTKDSQMFVYGLKDEFIPIKKRLFMTATERIVSPRIKASAENFGQVIFSMDDVNLYGETLSKLNFGEAIKLGIISDYKIVLCTINEEDLEELYSNNKIVSTEIGEQSITTNIDTLLKQMLVVKAMKELNVKKVITYHSLVKNASTFAYGSNSVLPLAKIIDNSIKTSDNTIPFVSHINGTMSAGTRKQILRDFENSDIGVITNAKCLTEGVDVPVIDAVYFVDPKNSIVDIVQAVGRALRKSKQKTNEFSYILVPMIIPKNASMFSHLNPSVFDTLHNVIQALRDQDDRLADIIDEINFNAATTGISGKNNKLSSKVIILPYSKIMVDDFEEALQLRIAEINKNPKISDSNMVKWTEVTPRKSAVKRVFVSIGDYSLDSYLSSLILPTLKKFESANDIVDGKKLKINHNNVSHSRRLGIIKKDKNNYSLTPIGKILYEDISQYDSIVKEQLLKYYNENSKESNILFPYRALLKIFLEFDSISRFEFLYSIYSLRDTTPDTINRSIERIYYLRSTYPNIHILNEQNKTKVLELLNVKFGIKFGFKDVWTSRTTAYNQFNYFKKHLWAFDNIFDNDEKDKENIKILPGTQSSIKQLLEITSIVEELADKNNKDELYEKYINKITSI